MATNKAQGTYIEKPRLEDESRERKAFRISTGATLHPVDGEASHLKALSSLDTVEDKLDYIDVHLSQGTGSARGATHPAQPLNQIAEPG